MTVETLACLAVVLLVAIDLAQSWALLKLCETVQFLLDRVEALKSERESWR